MFIKKIKIANECANYVNRIESTMAMTPNFPTESLIHFLGQREAFNQMYKMIMETNPKSDEIAVEDVLAFVGKKSRENSSEAFNLNLDLNFPQGKRLALGQVMAYKTVEQILLTLKSEQDAADSDSD